MGQLIDGVWHDTWYDTKSTGGRFKRSVSAFRNWLTADGAPGPSGDGGFAAACLRRLGVADERLVRLDEATLAAVTEQVSRRTPAAQTDGEVTLFAAGNRKGFVA